jgi:hypothetical protein
MTIDLNAHQLGVIIRLSMKEDCAALTAGNHKRERQGIPPGVLSHRRTVQKTDHNSILMPDPYSDPVILKKTDIPKYYPGGFPLPLNGGDDVDVIAMFSRGIHK